jgi:hypothetical protein
VKLRFVVATYKDLGDWFALVETQLTPKEDSWFFVKNFREWFLELLK